MNASAAQAIPTINGYIGEYRPVWASHFRKVQMRGQTIYFKTPEAAELAAWRTLYAIEQRVMKRDGEIVFAAKSQAHAIFKNGRKIPIQSNRRVG